jgi:hypothetical protein
MPTTNSVYTPSALIAPKAANNPFSINATPGQLAVNENKVNGSTLQLYIAYDGDYTNFTPVYFLPSDYIDPTQQATLAAYSALGKYGNALAGILLNTTPTYDTLSAGAKTTAYNTALPNLKLYVSYYAHHLLIVGDTTSFTWSYDGVNVHGQANAGDKLDFYRLARKCIFLRGIGKGRLWAW